MSSVQFTLYHLSLFAGLLCVAAPAQTPGGAWEQRIVLSGQRAFDELGSEIARGEDFNLDGHPDVIVGSGWASVNGFTSGAVTVFSGRTGHAMWRFDGPYGGMLLGSAVACAGDTNGDGYPDVVAGGPWFGRNGQVWMGSVYVLSGKDGSILWSKEGPMADMMLGFSVSGGVDINNDGFDDVIAGAPRTIPNNGVLRGGMVYAYSGLDGSILHEHIGTLGLGFLGWDVTALGDLNSDGFAEYAASAAYGSSQGKNENGVVYVYYGQTGNTLQILHGEFQYDHFGYSIASAGDLNDDDLTDLVVGAPEYGLENKGAVYAYTLINFSKAHFFEGQNADDQLGIDVDGGADVDGDGIPDLIAGAWLTDYNALSNSGSAYVYSGANGAILQRIDGHDSPVWAGESVACLNDLQGDGLAEIAVGIPKASPNGRIQAGEVWIHGLDPFLNLAQETLSVSANESVRGKIQFPASEGGQPYAVLASGSGVGPTPVFGSEVPLTKDRLFHAMAAPIPPRWIKNARGLLNSNGRASFLILDGPALNHFIGRTFHVAAISFDPASQQVRRTTMPRRLSIEP